MECIKKDNEHVVEAWKVGSREIPPDWILSCEKARFYDGYYMLILENKSIWADSRYEVKKVEKGYYVVRNKDDIEIVDPDTFNSLYFRKE